MGEKRRSYTFGRRTRREETTRKTLGVEIRIYIITELREMERGMEWIHLAQDRDQYKRGDEKT
jgi:hypothetical protein